MSLLTRIAAGNGNISRNMTAVLHLADKDDQILTVWHQHLKEAIWHKKLEIEIQNKQLRQSNFKPTRTKLN